MGKMKVHIEGILNGEIGTWIHKLRHDCRMGVEEVARTLNRTVKEVEDWEAGNSAPSFSELLTLLRLYQVDPQLVGAKLSLFYLNHSARISRKTKV